MTVLHHLSLPARLCLGFALFLALAAFGAALTLHQPAPPRVIRVASIEALQRAFADFDYSLAEVRASGRVPRLTISDIPENWDDGLDTAARKQVFFESVLPLVLIANERVDRERRRLDRIADRLARSEEISEADWRWIGGLAMRYRVDWPSGAQKADSTRVNAALDTLRRRVGPVPPSLALSQAAVESAYGTSRFAATGNALFSQCTAGEGLTPARQRATKAGWTVAAFASPQHSVDAYLRNLNTHRAYRDFRRVRRQMTKTAGDLSGESLAPTLAAYSEKGAAYTHTLRDIIRHNDLAVFDRAALDAGRRVLLVVP
jgi:Bax protein